MQLRRSCSDSSSSLRGVFRLLSSLHTYSLHLCSSVQINALPSSSSTTTWSSYRFMTVSSTYRLPITIVAYIIYAPGEGPKSLQLLRSCADNSSILFGIFRLPSSVETTSLHPSKEQRLSRVQINLSPMLSLTKTKHPCPFMTATSVDYITEIRHF